MTAFLTGFFNLGGPEKRWKLKQDKFEMVKNHSKVFEDCKLIRQYKINRYAIVLSTLQSLSLPDDLLMLLS